MTTILAYLFYFVATSASSLQRRWLAREKAVDTAGQINLVFKATLLNVLFSPVLLLFSPLEFKGDIGYLILLSVISGIFGAAFLTLSFTAQKHVEAGVTSILGNIYTPVTILTASFFLSESLTPIQIIGTALLLVSAIIVSNHHRIGRFSFDKYFWMMLIGGIMLGLALTAERALQIEAGFTAGTMMSWISQSFFLGIVALVIKSRSSYSLKDTLITGSLRFLQQLSWVVLIFVVGNISIVSSITTFKIVIIFITAAIFLGERKDIGHKIIGSIIAVVGLLLMK